MPENKVKAGRNSKGQFKKGVSGNPGGRPKKPEKLEEYGIEAFERVAKMAKNSENEKIRFDANKWLCEMAFGKPTQSAEIEGNVNLEPVIFTGSDEIAE